MGILQGRAAVEGARMGIADAEDYRGQVLQSSIWTWRESFFPVNPMEQAS